jgi:hypothetical protein
MPSPFEGLPYEVHNSSLIAQAFRRLQRRATREGRGQDLLRAVKEVYERLRQNPWEFGEPLYRLPAMRMQIRSAVIRLSMSTLQCAKITDWSLSRL